MKASKIVLAGLIGGILALGLGFLVFGLALSNFPEENMGSGTAVMRAITDFNWVAMAIGHLALGFLYAIVFGVWTNTRSFVDGAKAGATIGFLFSLTNGMIAFGSTNVTSLPGTLVYIIVGTILSAIVGSVVGALLARGER